MMFNQLILMVHIGEGDIFISLGHQSMIILYRPSSNKIVWKYDTNIFHQHDVTLLATINIDI